MKQKQLRKQNWHEMEIVSVSSKNEEFSTTENHQYVAGMSQKVMFLILLLLGFSTFSNAQFQWGVKLGANASTQSELGNICDDNSLKGGFNAGILAKYQLNDWMALKSGIDYQLKGQKCDDKVSNQEISSKLSYLVLPVKVEISAGEKIGFKNGQRAFFATGPYFGYLLDAEQTYQDVTTDLNDLNDGDFGWAFELGFEFPVFKTKALQVSLNYDMGISEIAEGTDVQNKSASINLGLLF